MGIELSILRGMSVNVKKETVKISPKNISIKWIMLKINYIKMFIKSNV